MRPILQTMLLFSLSIQVIKSGHNTHTTTSLIYKQVKHVKRYFKRLHNMTQKSTQNVALSTCISENFELLTLY